MPQMLSVNIPFAGFYNSAYSGMIDYEEESFAEYRADLYETDYPDNEGYWPGPLQLNQGEIAEILFGATDYAAAYLQTARDYAAAFDQVTGQAFGWSKRAKSRVRRYDRDGWQINLRWDDTAGIAFEEMTSPREYNFETDRIFVLMPAYRLQQLFAKSRADGHKVLSEVIKERFTSYDGFISGYRNRLVDWLAKPLVAWDHNELGTLLIAALRLADMTERDVESACYDLMTDGDGARQNWEDSVDWKRFDRERAEKRAEKLCEWLEVDKPAALQWCGNHPEDFDGIAATDLVAFGDVADSVPYRCKLTPDLFEGIHL